MINKFKIIPTNYKGYKFRSRTEARWAVYFDSIGLKWEYEKEGFYLNSKIKYLPDFWLSDVNMWAEVKGKEFTKEEIEKCELLAKETGYTCLLLEGPPNLRSYNGILYSQNELIVTDYMISMFHNYPKTENRFYSSTGYENPYTEIENNPDMYEDIILAVNKSREIRFEYE